MKQEILAVHPSVLVVAAVALALAGVSSSAEAATTSAGSDAQPVAADPSATPPPATPPAGTAPPARPPAATPAPTATQPPAAAPPPGFTPPGPATAPPSTPTPSPTIQPPPTATPATGSPPPVGASATAPPPGTPAGTPATAPPPAEASAAPPGSYAGKADASTYSRKGMAAGALLGIRACTQRVCGRSEDRIRAGAVGRALFELRFHRNVGVEAELGASYHRIDGGEGFRAFASSWSLAAVVMAYPLAFTRFDPYVGLGVGFNQDRTRYIDEEVDDRFQSWSNRGELRLALGLDVFLNDTITLGPRLDYGAQFAGKFCDEATNSKKDCVGFGEIDDDEFRAEIPRWIVVGLQFKAHFGGKKQ